MKNRTRALLVAPAALAVGFLAGVGPASAASSPNANCVGQAASTLNQIQPGLGGQLVSSAAHEAGGLGQFASTDCDQK